MERVYNSPVFFIVVFLGLSTGYKNALCQSGAVRGVILEQSANLPVEFCTISLYKSSDSTWVAGSTTGAKGEFTITDVKSGRYYAMAQFVGYTPSRVPDILVQPHQTVDVGTLILAPKEHLLNEVTINGEKSTSLQLGEKQIYTATNFGSAQGGNALEAIRNLPSISVNGEGEITLRGTSGFIVLLDGKAVQADPLVILNQLPANSIERIELMTTPSAKFDPDGKAGILNIITKKGTTDGSYILTNLRYGLPSTGDFGNEVRPVRFGGDITADIKRGDWSISLSGNYKRDDIAGYRDGQAHTWVDDTYTTFPSLGERSYRTVSYGVRGVVGYQINKKSSIDAGFYAGKKSQFRKANIRYHQQRFYEDNEMASSSFDYFNKNLRERKGDFLVTNLDYTHVFANAGKWTLSGLYEKTILGGPTANTDVNPLNDQQIYNDARMEEENPLQGIRFKSDVQLPIGKTARFETGYQYRYLLHRGDFVYHELSPATGEWFIREALSNSVKLTRSIHSLYGQVAGEIKKLTYSGGLRLEYVNRVLTDEGVAEPYRFERLNLFPSANVQYRLRDGYKIKAGYSRRIAHTTSNMMNPFPARRHSEVFEIGDPNLLPEYIDAVEVGGVKDFGDNEVFLNVYYRHTRNVINRVNSVYNDTILYRTYTNAGDATAVGIEAGVDFKVTRWWTFYAGANLYNYHISGEVFQSVVQTNGINYSFNGNTTFRIMPSLTFQLTVNYTSLTITAQGDDSRFLVPSATVKKTFMKGLGSVSLQWQNIDLGKLDSNQQRITTGGKDFFTSTNYMYEVDVFRVNISFQLNKLSKKLVFTESEFGEKEF